MQLFGSLPQVCCAIRHAANFMWLHGDDQIIAARQLVLQVPKCFSESSFDAVPDDGIADLA